MMAMRRKLALLLCPELAELPYDAIERGRPRATCQQAASDAAQLMRLDRLYAAATGCSLTMQSAPDYSGPMYQWRTSRQHIKMRVLDALIRLRAGRQGGVQRTTAFVALNYFSAIWPADLEWPADIRRPDTTDQRRAS